MRYNAYIMKDKSKKIHSDIEQSDEDKALWIEVIKDIEPLKDNNIDFTIDELEEEEFKISYKQYDKAKDINYDNSYKKINDLTRTDIYSKSKDIDRRTEQRLRRGQLDIEGRLDLHGMNQNQAYDALLDFIPKSYNNGKRCVLIITGKGYRRHSDQSLLERTNGVLKQKTPQWLDDMPLSNYVLNVQTAKPKHGGEGALYVLLRRNRG